MFKEHRMAIKDVRNYFYTMLSQYIEEKQNLADFEDALKNGLITEDQMQEVIATVAGLEENYHRLAYIMYLFDMPNRPCKKERYIRQNKVILDEFERLGADLASVKKENTDMLAHFKLKLKALTEKGEH
jgi:hypothetical protein